MSTFSPAGSSQFDASASPSRSQPASSFFIFAVALSLLFLAYIVYLFVSQLSVQKEAENYKQEVASLQQQVQTLRDKKVGSLEKAKLALDQIDAQRIYWSHVIGDVLLILPKDSKTNTPRTDFLSYSGSSDGKLMLSAKTINGSQNPYTDIADIVSAFTHSVSFSNAFVPTISKNQNEQGQTVLTYVLNLAYHGK